MEAAVDKNKGLKLLKFPKPAQEPVGINGFEPGFSPEELLKEALEHKNDIEEIIILTREKGAFQWVSQTDAGGHGGMLLMMEKVKTMMLAQELTKEGVDTKPPKGVA